MNVSSILKVKGPDVVRVGADSAIGEVAKTLAANKIGAVLVTGEAGGLVGIVSERDIIRAIAQQGGDCLSESVSTIMTKNVISCGVTDTVDQVMSMMTSGRFRHMPVMEGEVLAGIISIGDVVKNHIAEVEMEASALRSYIVSS